MFSKLSFGFWALISCIIYIPLVLYHMIFESNVKKLYQTNLRKTNLSNQIIIITGSNTGIGKETAKTLACLGGHVILACRDINKAKAACLEIMSELKNANHVDYPHKYNGKVSHIPLDLSSLSSVVAFIDIFKRKYDHVDILINNAGTNASGVSDDGIEQVFQINYLGHYLLTMLLEPLLSHKKHKADQTVGRIVNLSSVMHHVGTVDFTQDQYITHTNPRKFDYYSDSKLYMNLLTIECNRRFGGMRVGRPVRAVSCNPGAVRSDIWRHVPKVILVIYDIIMRILYLSVEQGCMTSVHGAILSDNDMQNYQLRYKHTFHDSDDAAAYWTYHPLLPYIIPYKLYRRWLCFELIGPVASPSFGEASLPKQANTISPQLWTFSKDVCLQKLASKLEKSKYDEVKSLLDRQS